MTQDLDTKAGQGDSLSNEGEILLERVKSSISGLSKEQQDKLFAARQSTYDKQIAQLQKEVESHKKTAEEVVKELAALQKAEQEKQEREWQDRLQEAEGNPEALSQLRREEKLRKQEADLAKRTAELAQELADHEADKAAANEVKKGQLAQELAKEFGIDAETLLTFKADTPEEMRENAEKLSKIAPASQGRLKPDSGVGGAPAVDFEKLSPVQKIAYGLRQKK